MNELEAKVRTFCKRISIDTCPEEKGYSVNHYDTCVDDEEMNCEKCWLCERCWLSVFGLEKESDDDSAR